MGTDQCPRLGLSGNPVAPPRRYFDNAATSFPKPAAVAAAMHRYMVENGSPGRGVYAGAREAGREILRCRQRILRLINGEPEHPENVVFALNTTDALNLAIKGTLAAAGRGRRAVHVVTTVMEHNSVLRPANATVTQGGGVEWTYVEVDPSTGVVDPAAIARAFRPDTVLVAVNHASNVTGSIQPVGEVGYICRERDIMFLVDAAQSLGHIPVDVRAMSIDLLAFAGHKGLLGPQGTGGLYIRPGIEQRIATTREGGTGSSSELDVHPSIMPERYEAGSHNTVGIIGLSEGVAWLAEKGIDQVRTHELALMRPLLAAAAGEAFPGLRLLGSPSERDRVGVFSFVHGELEPVELAIILEMEFGILCRAGLHCAPLAHAAFRTAPPRGKGAVRLSVGPFLTGADVQFAVEALSAVCRSHRRAFAAAR